MKTRRELIVQVIDTVKKKYIDNNLEISAQLSNSLRKKYEKCGKDEEKYVELLKYNIIYFKSIIKKLEAILELWIHNDIISSPQSVKKSVENITASSKKYVNSAIKEGYSKLNDRDKNIYHSYDNSVGYKKLEKIENDYRILSLYKDILNMVLSTISSNADEYKFLLEMGIEEVRVDLMMEIFSTIDDILFSESEVLEEDSNALVSEDSNGVVTEQDKTRSLIKYMSMMSAPEVSVRINDMMKEVLEDEGIDDEDDYYTLPDELKDYASSVILLMDYIGEEEKTYFRNAFKLLVNGEIDSSLFVEIMEKLIRDYTFMDSISWNDAQNVVKSDFNLDKNKLFRKLIAPKDESMEFSDVIDVVRGFSGEGSIMDYNIEDDDRVSKKIMDKFQSFSQKMKIKKNDDTYDSFSEEDYDDEYENEEESFYEEDYDENEEESRFSLKRLGKIFKSEHDEEPYEDEINYKNVSVDDKKFRGDSAIQNDDAVAMLKLREASKQIEEENSLREQQRLLNEKKLAEEIKKKGKSTRFENEDIVTSDDDFVYRPNEYNIDSDKNVKKSDKNIKKFDSNDFKKNDKNTKRNDKNLLKNISSHSKDENTSAKSGKNIVADKNNKSAHIKLNDTSDKAKEFAELEFLKSMKDGEKVDLDNLKHYSGVEKSAKTKVDLSSLGKKNTSPDEFKASEYQSESIADTVGDSSKKERRFNFNIPKLSGKSKLARDISIIAVLMIVVVFGYVYAIKSFKMPSVSDTNRVTKEQEVAKGNTSKSGDKTADSTKKNSAKKKDSEPVDTEKQSAEEKASALQREAEQYKGAKSRYYTVYVGASKSEDGMQETADRFKNRGVDAKLIRNAGYYMLKVGEYFNYNEAYAESQRISAKGIQNYVAGRNKYFDLMIEALQVRMPYMTKEQLTTDYNDLRNQIQSTGKDQAYITNLDEIYNSQAKLKQ